MRFRSISKIWKFVLLNECMPAIGRKKVAAVWPRQVKCCSCIHCAILSTYHSQSFIAYVALSSLVQNKTLWELSDIYTRIRRTFPRAQEIFLLRLKKYFCSKTFRSGSELRLKTLQAKNLQNPRLKKGNLCNFLLEKGNHGGSHRAYALHRKSRWNMVWNISLAQW